jgi:hypothetical protein
MKAFLVIVILILLIGCAGIQKIDDPALHVSAAGSASADPGAAASDTVTPTLVPEADNAAPSSDQPTATQEYPANQATPSDTTVVGNAAKVADPATEVPAPENAAGASAETASAIRDPADAAPSAPDNAAPSANKPPATGPAADLPTDDQPATVGDTSVSTAPANAAANTTPEVVFDSSAIPMVEPEDDGLTLDFAENVVSQPEVQERPVLDEPLPPPLPDPLNSRQISKFVFSEIGNGLLPVHRSGTALYLLHDIDGDGYNDVFALAVRGDEREAAEFANVHDYTRLYKAEREAARFYLRLFYQKNGALIPGDLVSLGERLVVDSFQPFALIEGKNTPFVVSIVFTTLQGRVREWVIFAGDKPSRFSMQERTGEIPRIEDIDSDGVIDVVIYEETFEIGIGNETYLTWYRWNGADFSRRGTVNVVRNLRSFLEDSFESIRNGDWGDFSQHTLSVETRAALPDEELAGFEIFHRVFALAATDESFRNQAVSPGEDIRKTVYPEIRENPFSQRDSAGFFFPLTVRFETSTGRNHLYTTRVYMLPNPFGERQFGFFVSAD